ncbi:MAG: nucleoside-triphosphatase [bacterium]
MIKTIVKKVFIAGSVGVGKTTLIKELMLQHKDVVGGFYTDEIKDDGRRRGFKIVSLDGREGLFSSKGMKTAHKYGKYGVDLSVLEAIGVSAMLDALAHKKIVVVDEIGSMEILSKKFHETLMKCLLSDIYVLATMRVKSQPFSDDIKQLADKKIFVLNRENFADIKNQIRDWITQCLKE